MCNQSFGPSDDTALEHVFVNLSKRQVKILDEEGYEADVNWNWESSGTNGFVETLAAIREVVPADQVTIYD